MKKVLIVLTMLLSFGFTNAQSNGSSNISGIYQAYIGSEEINIDGKNMYYVVNSKGIILIALGSSTGSAFYDISGGIKSGRITTGTYNRKGNSLTFMIGESKTRSSWNFSPSQNAIIKSDKNTKLIYVESS
jgi:hypothetical protein